MPNESHTYQSKFRKLLLVQVILVIIALIAFLYISSKVSVKMEEYRSVEQKLTQARREYDALKANTEKLYSVKVTPQNEVYEVKATAEATGRLTEGGKPEYRFSVYLNSPPELLSRIRKVTYDFNHPTFTTPHVEEIDPGTMFATHYIGWGCLRNVVVTVFLEDNTVQTIDFDMCRSIGWQ